MRQALLAVTLAAPLVGGLTIPRAHADVLAPLPERCTEGSAPVGVCHGPPTCRALTCETDADCEGGLICRARPLCVREHCCSGRGCGDPSTATYYTHVDASCAGGAACAGWDTACETIKVCVPSAQGDAGSGTMDAGGADEDGGASMDAGGSSTDAGGSGDDAGGDRDDGGHARADSGQRDAGGGATSGGGCCSATGKRSALGGALFLALMIATALRRSRRG